MDRLLLLLGRRLLLLWRSHGLGWLQVLMSANGCGRRLLLVEEMRLVDEGARGVQDHLLDDLLLLLHLHLLLVLLLRLKLLDECGHTLRDQLRLLLQDLVERR